MTHFFSDSARIRRFTLALGLLTAGHLVAQAQSAIPTTPTSIFGLGYNVATGATFIATLNPATINSPTGQLITSFMNVDQTNLVAGQRLLAIDARPSTGLLYALGYDNTKTSGNAQLYTLALNAAGSAYVLNTIGTTPVLLTLDLQDPSKGAVNSTANSIDFNTVPKPTPQLTNVGFDFNPRADRIRVVGPRSSSAAATGTNYTLNPNTGALNSTDTNVAGSFSYIDPSGNTQTAATYVGAVAYTNSTFGVAGTTLYDLGINNSRGTLSIQGSPASGVLTQQSNLTFATLQGSATPSYSGYVVLNSPTVRLDLDFYYDRGSRRNIAYVVEARRNPNNNGYSSNLYTLDYSTGQPTSGQATGKNIYGASDAGQPSFIYDIAALSTSPKVWIGKSATAPTAWNDNANWFPAGVPTSTDDVLIPGNGTFVAFGSGYTVTTQPVVSTTSTTAPNEALSVTLSNGALLTTTDGGTLNIYGDFVNTDSQVAGSGTGVIALVGAATQDISGNTPTNFYNLSVGTAGATTSQVASVARALTVAGTLAIGQDQAFTLRSSASGQAYVVNVGSGAVTGTATVQRYIDPSLNAGAGYRHYAAPVTNTTVNDLATSSFTPVFNTAYNSSATPGTTTPFPTVYGYNQAQFNGSPAVVITTNFDKGFYSPASGDAMVPGTGYAVEIGSSQLVDFAGTLANGSYSTPAQGRSSNPDAGWQLLGNPYPSALDWDLVTSTGGLVNLRGTVYVVKSSGPYSGTYASYINGQATNGGSRYIPVAQGFFVQTSAVGAAGNINFTNAQRVTTDNTAPFQRTTADLRPQLLLELAGGAKAIQTDIYFESGATTGLDNAYDAPAMPFIDNLVLASGANADVLAINGLPALMGSVTVPLRVAAGTAGTYTLRAATLANLPTGYHAYLRDASTGAYTDLATTPSVNVTLAAGEATTGRFTVLFSATSPLATAPAALAALAAVYPSPAHGTATLVLPQALRGTSASTVQLLNTLGQVVLTKTLAAGSGTTVELPLAGVAPGIYTVRATTEAGIVAKRLVVQ